jgi:ketosteroid isomerase-like protein
MDATLSSSDLEALQKHLVTWTRSAVAGDWDAVGQILSDDVEFLPPDAPRVTGRGDVCRWLHTFPPVSRFDSVIDDVKGTPDLAWTRGHFVMTLALEQPLTFHGKWVATWRRRDGVWECTSDIWNADGPPTT